MYANGVSVHILEPGFFGTPLVRYFQPENARRLAKEKFDTLSSELKDCYGVKYVDKCNGSLLFSFPVSQICKIRYPFDNFSPLFINLE